jgi:hypothetical protein
MADCATDRSATISQESAREIFSRNRQALVFLMFLRLSLTTVDLSQHEDNLAPESGKAFHRLASAFQNLQGAHLKFRELLPSFFQVVA